MRQAAYTFGIAVVTAVLVPASLMRATQGDTDTSTSAQSPRITTAIAHDTSRPLREMVRPLTDVPIDEVDSAPEIRPFDHPRIWERYEREHRAQPITEDPLRQVWRGEAPAPAPTITFEGPSADDSDATPGVRRVAPPDPVGDVGPNHWISMVNLVTTIYHKDGTVALGPFANSELWADFAPPCSTVNGGEPIVLYDQLADRWMLSQRATFGVQCVAVSTGSDPTETFHRYAFPVSQGNNRSPKLGLWPDGYYLSFNETSGGDVRAQQLTDGEPVFCALQRDAMLIGAAAQMVCFLIAPLPNGDVFWAAQPAHLEGMTRPPGWAPAPFIMAYDDEIWGGDPDPAQDFYKIWHFAVDWGHTGDSTLTGPIDVPTAEFDADQCRPNEPGDSCVPQPDTDRRLDSFALASMYRAVYRHFGDEHVDGAHESLWLNHTVNADGSEPPGLAGIRWTEVRDPLGSPIEHQAGTWAPDDEHRFLGSLSVDDVGNMLLAYSLSSENTYPSIRYAGRLVTDPLGELSQEENELWAGTGSELGLSSWGRYSSVSLDESDGCSFWMTNEYKEETTTDIDWKTRVGATHFASCAAAEAGTVAGMVTAADTGDAIVGAMVTAEHGNGTLVETNTDDEGHYALLVPAGTYAVTVSAYGFTPQTVPDVVVTDESRTPVDFQLEAAATISLDGFVTDGSAAGWPLYASVTISAEGADPLVLHTDPTTGYYVAELFIGIEYTLAVTAIAPAGYAAEERTVITGEADRQENFALMVDESCTTPGYVFGDPLVTQDFEDTFPSDGWEVTHDTEACDEELGHPAWNTENLSGRDNMTGGSGLFAIANPDACGFGTSMLTDMTTPVMDLTAVGEAGTLRIAWNHDSHGGSSSVAQLQAWNGTAWVTIADFSGMDHPGPVRHYVRTPVGVGLPNAKLRWHYEARGGSWQVDDVEIRVGSCEYQGASVISGHVYDANTSQPLNGALIEVDTGQVVTTVATPNDPNLDDGFYSVSVPLSSRAAPGVRTLTVTADNYVEQTRQVVPTPGSSQREDFELPAGLLSLAPEALRARMPVGAAVRQRLTVSNPGTADLTFDIVELNFPPAPEPPEGGWPQERLQPAAAGASEEIPRTRQDVLDVLNDQSDVAEVMTLERAGQWVSQFPTGAPHGSAVGWYPGRDTVWVTDSAHGGGDPVCYEYEPDGVLTGNTIDCRFDQLGFPTDLTYNPRTGTLWVINVGGDNCLHEIDPVALEQTENTICGPWNDALNGVAFDPASNTYYVADSSELGRLISQVTPDGRLVRSVVTGLDARALAYNPNTQHLFVPASDARPLVHVLDAADPDLAHIGAIELLDEHGDPAYDEYVGAGLTLDCGGNLVSLNRQTQTVFVNTSGEVSTLCDVDIPWLEVAPTSETVGAGGSRAVDAVFHTLGMTPRCEEAHLRIDNDTPYGTAIVPASITVAFGDVAPDHVADRAIHGLATAQISLGCGGGLFCPDDLLARNAAAVWLTRARHGVDVAVPPATGLVFDDVAPGTYGADEIELLFGEGVINGCGGNPSLFCPNESMPREEMAVWQLRALEGADYVPPACQGTFDDVPCPGTSESPFADWIEEVYRRVPAVACSESPLLFCPGAPVTRAEAATFTVGTFDLPACRP